MSIYESSVGFVVDIDGHHSIYEWYTNGVLHPLERSQFVWRSSSDT